MTVADAAERTVQNIRAAIPSLASDSGLEVAYRRLPGQNGPIRCSFRYPRLTGQSLLILGVG